MKEILQNLAMILLLNKCEELNINTAGTHIVKLDRRFTYELHRDSTRVINVTLHKNSVPTYLVYTAVSEVIND